MTGRETKSKTAKKGSRTRYRDQDFLNKLGKRIRKARTNKGYSIDRVHLEAENLSRSTITRIETGQADPQISTLRRVAQIIGVRLRDLIDIE